MARSQGRRARNEALRLIASHPKPVTLLARLDERGPHGQPCALFTNGQVSGWPAILKRLKQNIQNRSGA